MDLNANWIVLGRPGAVLGRLGGILGPLGGRLGAVFGALDFLDPSWDRLGLHFGRFLGACLDGISIIFSSYLKEPQHVVKQNNHLCNTGEPSDALYVQYM